MNAISFNVNSQRSLLRRCCFLLTTAFILLVSNLRAIDLTADFDAANKLYEQGHFADAANAYDKLIATGRVSEALYFNRGNALFKLGQVGRAIASYRQAQLLAPRDATLRANLQFARTRARGGLTFHGDRWRSWLSSLSLNEWAIATSVAVWAVFIMLALQQWQPELKPKLRTSLLVATIAAILLGTCLALTASQDYFVTTAIVATGEADVRNGPLDESPSIFKVRDGIELEVVDKKDKWLQVSDSAQRVGWLRQDQVVIFEPAAQTARPLNLLEGGGK